jgi:hypothetical protein
MSWALIGIVGGLTVAIGVLAGAGWWFGKRGFDAMDRYVAEADNAIELQTELADARLTQERTIETLKHVQSERDRERKGRQTLQRQLGNVQELLMACSSGASSGDRTAGIRAALDRLRGLSEEVSDLPEAPTTDNG